jgi:hypothetical protein
MDIKRYRRTQIAVLTWLLNERKIKPESPISNMLKRPQPIQTTKKRTFTKTKTINESKLGCSVISNANRLIDITRTNAKP